MFLFQQNSNISLNPTVVPDDVDIGNMQEVSPRRKKKWNYIIGLSAVVVQKGVPATYQGIF